MCDRNIEQYKNTFFVRLELEIRLKFCTKTLRETKLLDATVHRSNLFGLGLTQLIGFDA